MGASVVFPSHTYITAKITYSSRGNRRCSAVRSGHFHTTLPTCDAGFGVAKAHIRELTTTCIAKAAMEQGDRLNDNASRDIAFLSSELDRLADEVVGMARAVNLGEQRHGESR